MEEPSYLCRVCQKVVATIVTMILLLSGPSILVVCPLVLRSINSNGFIIVFTYIVPPKDLILGVVCIEDLSLEHPNMCTDSALMA